MINTYAYQRIWDVILREMLECARKPLNEYDRHSVVVEKDGTIIGHLPRNLKKGFKALFTVPHEGG